MYHHYIARQAILNRKSQTIGYELLFRDSKNNAFPEVDPDLASSKLIVENYLQGDINALTLQKPAFINFTPKCLINKYPLLFDRKNIIIELVGHNKFSDNLLKIVKFYAQKGYKIALTGYDTDSQWDGLFPFIKLIKIDIEKINPKRLKSLESKIKDYDIKLVAEKVETRFQLQSLAEIGFDLFQGFFYHKPEIIEGKKLAPNKVQMLKLISESVKDPINFDVISEIISQDVNLTYGLLKLVNNVMTSTRVEIVSIKQAATYLGEEKLKEYVSILALSQLSSNETDEAAKQALITAKLMQQLSKEPVFEGVDDYAFITGLLSAIEAILNMPMEDVVETVAVAAPIKSALVDHDGILGELLVFCTGYITGKNGGTKQKINHFKLDPKSVQQAFVDASRWCYDVTHALAS